MYIIMMMGVGRSEILSLNHFSSYGLRATINDEDFNFVVKKLAVQLLSMHALDCH